MPHSGTIQRKTKNPFDKLPPAPGLRRTGRAGKQTIVPFGGKAQKTQPQPMLHGGKAASLLRMTTMGLNVPPGFILTTESYRSYCKNPQEFKKNMEGTIRDAMKHIEKTIKRRFGNPYDPILVSVRSGAPVSMPGMMDTILNLGLYPESVRNMAETKGTLFAWGSFLRLISQFTSLVLNTSRLPLVVRQAHHDTALGVAPPTVAKAMVGRQCDIFDQFLDMGRFPKTGEEARERSLQALEHLKHTGTPFPENPWEQLWLAIGTVFRSWDNDRAKIYRKLQNIPESLGTACTVQAMVFGNRNEKSGTGVCFSRDPSTGERGIAGEYLPMGQGEDVVAGIRTPLPIRTTKTNTCHAEVPRLMDSRLVPRQAQDSHLTMTGGASKHEVFEKNLEGLHPHLFQELSTHVQTLEQELRDIVDVEFTIEDSVLYFLQCRGAKRSAEAAMRCAHDMFKEGTITEEEMLTRVTTDHVKALLRPHFDFKALDEARKTGAFLAKGLPAGPGAASGRIFLGAGSSVGEGYSSPTEDPWILIRRETSPEDVGAMMKAAGVLTVHGGMSSHAALVARQLGIVCIVGCEDAVIDAKERTVWFKEKPLNEGEWISIDGTTGEVFAGRMPTITTTLEESPLPPLLVHADTKRRLGVYANADTPEQASIARTYGAEGIGLARTEHMFFGSDRLPLIQRLIVSKSEEERRAALEKLEELQTHDFYGLLLAMNGLPMTVRTIDPPLHEFLPKKEEDIENLADMLGVSSAEIKNRILEMHESNPMLGFRGCRLGILHPEIPTMQVRALAKATVNLLGEGKNPRPEIMIPLTSTAKELMEHRKVLEEEINHVMVSLSNHEGEPRSMPIGTMIEVPRAALVAEEIALFADFLSFGTNDLTQLTFGISRDDASVFLPKYVEKEIYPEDPFVSLDRAGVGKLMKLAVEAARSVKPEMKIGICGEHGGDPSSIHFCEELNLTYVSCSPYRIPVARLAAAQAQLNSRRNRAHAKIESEDPAS